MNECPRVAFLPDTFSEVNGVAHTARQLEAFARRRQWPLLSIHAGPETDRTSDGVVSMLQLKRSRYRFGLDSNLDYDPFLLRHARLVAKEIGAFQANVIHLTGPGDFGTLGIYVARLLKLPVVISWHTNLQEYAASRLARLLRFTGARTSRILGSLAGIGSREILRHFYRRATTTLAPNQELVNLTHSLTAKPCHLMSRGVDIQLFSPLRRKRVNNLFQIGYVGRLTPEKNVRFLAELGNALCKRGRTAFEFVIIGEGSEQNWLRSHIPGARFTGVLRGEILAQAYADMDLFVFPSHTDTFGNVVLEALASGVPAVVTSNGGPKYLVRNGLTGFVAANNIEFIESVDKLLADANLRNQMSQAARLYAQQQSWDRVFETVWSVYSQSTPLHNFAKPARHSTAPLLSSRVHGRSSS